MFDYAHFELVEGPVKDKDLVFFALTTCGFCRRAKAYLDSIGYQYRMINADELDPEVKNRLKQDFREQYNEVLHFPTLLIDGKEFLVGFIKPHWQMELES